ncbi:helix-turn-helix domain-containing protein [Rufibacter tibetensis]|nr:helix-turn-helix domain-containing protein [Rufibacter tibetensis]
MIDLPLKRFDDLERQLAMQNILKKPILTVGEAAEYLDLSTSQIYKLTSSRQLPSFCPNGKKLYLRRVDIDEWVLGKPNYSTAQLQSQALQGLASRKR